MQTVINTNSVTFSGLADHACTYRVSEFHRCHSCQGECCDTYQQWGCWQYLDHRTMV